MMAGVSGDAQPLGHREELLREAFTMALYVAICLLAALTALSDGAGHVFGLVWGTTIGLALAHWLAFRVSARLVAGGAFGHQEGRIAAAQFAGAGAVALLCTPFIAAMSAGNERDGVRLLLAGLIGFAGYRVARSVDASRARSAVYAGGVALVAIVVALVKNILVGH